MNQPKIRILNVVQEGNNQIQQGQRVIVDHIDPKRSTEFFQRLDNVKQHLDSDYQVEAYETNNRAVISQYWTISFKGEGPYDGKKISGVLKFQSNHPIAPPAFYFNLLEGQTIQHENIYIGGLLCIPLLSEHIWKQNTTDLEIIKAIQFIFHHPQPADAANVPFTIKPQEEREQIIRMQAQKLEVWKDEDVN